MTARCRAWRETAGCEGLNGLKVHVRRKDGDMPTEMNASKTPGKTENGPQLTMRQGHLGLKKTPCPPYQLLSGKVGPRGCAATAPNPCRQLELLRGSVGGWVGRRIRHYGGGTRRQVRVELSLAIAGVKTTFLRGTAIQFSSFSSCSGKKRTAPIPPCPRHANAEGMRR